MDQIEDLQARILAAMERISSGVSSIEASQQAAAAATPSAELEQALDEERMANAQLEERIRLLRARLDEAEVKLEAAEGQSNNGDAETIAALEAEVQLLRNEVGNTSERDALRAEVERLKGALEGAQNEAASAKEHCEMMDGEAARLRAELEAALEAAAPSSDPVISEVDFAALEAERNRLKGELETVTHALSAAEVQVAEAQAETAQAQAAVAEAQAVAEAAQAAASQAAAAPQPVPVEDDETLIRLDQELTTLRSANDQLVQANAALRAANAEGVGDPALINAALQAEVDGLRAANATDRAEMSAVMARLEPLLANAQNLPQGEDE